MPITKLSELLQIDQNGTTFFKISNYLKELGIHTKAYSLENVETLKQFSGPILIQVKQNNLFHFMVIYKQTSSFYIVMDPAYGKRKIKKEELSKIWTKKIMTFRCQDKLPVMKEQNHLKKEILNLISQNKKTIIIISVLSIIFTIFTYFCSFYFQYLLEKITSKSNSYFLYLFLVFVSVAFLKNLIHYIRNKIFIYLTQKLEYSIITKTIQKILSFPYTYYKRKPIGEWISRTNDLVYVKNFIAKLILTVSLDVLLIIIGAILLYKINSYLFLISLITIILYYVILVIFKSKIQFMTEKNLENNAFLSNQMIEMINSMESIKNLNIMNQIINKFKQVYQRNLKDSFHYQSLSHLETLCYEFLYQASIMITLTLGIIMIQNDHFHLSSLITYHTIFTYFLELFIGLFDLDKEYHLALKSYKRANALYDIESEELEKRTNHSLNGSIRIQNLSFSHQPENFVLKDLNLEIKDKQKVMIVGKSGTGKSTLLKILYKYYLIDNNQVFINDVDLNELTNLDIRDNICYVSQNEAIYTDTIYQNIVLDRNVSFEEVEKVCQITCVDEIIQTNPFGYDLLLEDNGSNLSGGQRARILLARALLKKSSIIMMDETLSEVDMNLERKILKNMFDYYKEKTFLVVSHRYNNIDLFDQVIHLEEKLSLKKNK